MIAALWSDIEPETCLQGLVSTVANAEIRQWYGPSQRHAQACVELTFANDGRGINLVSIRERLSREGHSLSFASPKEDIELPEAIALMASALLSDVASPQWSCGSEGDLGWVCLSHAHPVAARAALMASHKAAISCHEPGSALPAEFVRLAANPPKGDYLSELMRRAASDLGIGSYTVCRFPPVFQIGTAARGMHFYLSASQLDSYTGAVLAGDKRATTEVLARLNLPTTRPVVAEAADQVADLVRRVGFPCVIKPLRGARGEGVSTGVQTYEQVETAVAHAVKAQGFPLLIENHVEGDDHRLTVANNHLLWAYRKRPPKIVGDGVTTARDLILRENARRRESDEAQDGYLKPIPLGFEMETYVRDRYGIGLDAVLGAGQEMVLAGPANIAQGGTLEDVTSGVHPDNRILAIQVAKLFRIAAIGIDFITPDITRSWREVPCAIVEINCTPGFSGIGDASLLVRALYPGRLSGRVPCLVVTGAKAYRERIREPLLKALGACSLVTGIAEYVAPENVVSRTARVTPSVHAPEVEAILLDPRAEAVVIFCGEDRVRASGFPVDRCDILVASDRAKLPLRDHLADSILTGDVDADLLTKVVLDAVATYRGATGGLARPTLELQSDSSEPESDPSVFTVRCWRHRVLPRAWFWSQVPVTPTASPGMVSTDDMLRAVVAFAGERMGQSDAHGGRIELALEPSGYAWATASSTAVISFPSIDPATAREALLYGIDAVNKIVDFPV